MERHEVIQKIRQFVHEKMGENDVDVHGYRHVERVCKWARLIASQEGLEDLFLLDVSALLHDIGRSEEKIIGPDGKAIGHYVAGEKIARDFLVKMNYFQDNEIEKIVTGVRNHGSGEGDLFVKILQDADRMDLLGAIAIARSFAFFHDKPFYIDSKSFEMQQYRLDEIDWNSNDRPWHRSGADDLMLNLSLAESLNTVTAKKMAQEKIDFTKKFLQHLKEEIMDNI